MGSIAAKRSIDRVLEAHGEEIRREWESQVPPDLMPIFDRVELSNDLYAIRVTWAFKGDSILPGPVIDIDALIHEYPDCDIGY